MSDASDDLQEAGDSAGDPEAIEDMHEVEVGDLTEAEIEDMVEEEVEMPPAARIIFSGHAENLADYQVEINITDGIIISGIERDDAGDIRFFSSETSDPYTETEGKIPYWIEEFNRAGNNLIVWVKVNLTAGTDKTIYLYYGNGTAGSESNGDEVFEFFDDFDGSLLDNIKWVSHTGTDPSKFGTGSIDVSEGVINLNTHGDGGWSEIKSIGNFTFGNITQFHVYICAGGNDNARIGLGNNQRGGGYDGGGGFGDDCMYNYDYWAPHWGTRDKKFITRDNDNAGGVDIVFNFSEWIKMKMFSTGSRAELWHDDIQVAAQEDAAAAPEAEEIAPVYVWVHSYAPNLMPQVAVDWVFVRKYASPEPAVTVFPP